MLTEQPGAGRASGPTHPPGLLGARERGATGSCLHPPLNITVNTGKSETGEALQSEEPLPRILQRQ